MSLIVTVFVPTGIVMSGDSRTSLVLPTLNPQPQQTGQEIASTTAPQIHTPLVLSDATYKVFVLGNRFGVSTCGAALVSGMPVAHHMEQFEKGLSPFPSTTQLLVKSLLSHFRAMNPVPYVWFHVVGYDGDEPWIVFVDVHGNTTKRWNVSARANPSFINSKICAS